MEFLHHFSHTEHPLIFRDVMAANHGGDQPVICSMCEDEVMGQCYTCEDCNFILHKECASLPPAIQHPLHHRHPLTLLHTSSPHGWIPCDFCEKHCARFCYQCSSCKFDLHVRCAIRLACLMNLEGKRNDIIPEYFGLREHTFTYSEVKHRNDAQFRQKKKKKEGNDAQQIICIVCEKAIMGESISCSGCNYSIHKTCAPPPNPLKIKHPSHRKHPLFLTTYYNAICAICKKKAKFFYGCWICNYYLDMGCAKPAPCFLDPQVEEHRLYDFKGSSLRSFSFTCDACGTKSVNTREVPFLCTVCHIVVHSDCRSLPRTIRVQHHPQHILTHTYCLHLEEEESSAEDQPGEEEEESSTEDQPGKEEEESSTEDQQGKEEEEKDNKNEENEEHYSGNCLCGICLGKINMHRGGYCCSPCKFVAHAKCCQQFQLPLDWDSSCIGDGDTLEPSFWIVHEIQDGETKIVTEMKHFSHEHNLIRLTIDDECLANNPKCYGCMLSILSYSASPPPCYGCPDLDCDFFMHQACTELPRQIQIPLEGAKCRLSLHSKAKKAGGIFRCDGCYAYCEGFQYEETKHEFFSYCIRCINLIRAGTIKHKGHKHARRSNNAIFMSSLGSSTSTCNSCGCLIGYKLHFKCAACNFNLHLGCAALPLKTRLPNNKYDDHDLLLTSHPLDTDSYQSYCLICEEERELKIWFYYCAKCDFAAHTVCALGEYPYIKSGSSYWCNDAHPHPLTIAGKSSERLCCRCSNTCEYLAFECTHSECDFIIDWDCFKELYPL